MQGLVKRSILAFALVWLAGHPMVVAQENPSSPGQKPQGALVHKNQRAKANETYRTGFFSPSECKFDDGLMIDFKDGQVTVRLKDDGLMGGYVARGTMTFHLGNESCQITIQIRRRGE